MTKYLPVLLLSVMIAAITAPAHAEAPGEDEGLNAAIASVEHARETQTAGPVPQGQGGVPTVARDMSPMPTHSGC